jgi:uncharacterized membrane protein YfcA
MDLAERTQSAILPWARGLATPNRRWPKDRQRAIFQPVAVAIFAMSATWLGIKGSVSADTIRLFLFGFPLLLAGPRLGVKLYGHLGETAFRRVVLVLLFVSGAVLIF